MSLFAASSAFAQPEANYDESKVPEYTLPDPLVLASGERVTSASEWPKRREELLALVGKHGYGRTPTAGFQLSFETASVDEQALGGKAIRKEVVIHISRGERTLPLRLLVYLPAGANEPVPCFLGLNFNGNHAVHADPGITLSTAWMRNDEANGYIDHRATEKSRASEASRWQVDLVVSRGYGLATIYYGDIDPDFDDGFQNGLHPLFYEARQTKPYGHEWGSIGAWAFGLSRALDYLETDPAVDARKVAVIGHSRLGKTSLWAGAQDERFALVISNNSGCGGAALSKRVFGETVERINTSFPHWFCDNFKQYNADEAELPVDQHMLIALIAPRPVYVASAEKDLWADPRGEFLAAKHADPVYQLLGTDGLGVEEMPSLNEPVHGTIGYHNRTGEHDVTEYDWQQYMDFADKHLRAAPPGR